MKDENLIEYYPNGKEKHNIYYYSNGNKSIEHFYDEDGNFHRENDLPDYQEWYENGFLASKKYAVHGQDHNINGPADILFHSNGKISEKSYYLNNHSEPKLVWQNKIKNI